MLRTVMLNLSINFGNKINDRKTDVGGKGKRRNINQENVFVQT